jgi:hypothetical protein
MPAVLPDIDVAAIRHFCEQRVPPEAIDQVRVEAEVDTRAVTLGHKHEEAAPPTSIVERLDEIDRDPTGNFWG